MKKRPAVVVSSAAYPREPPWVRVSDESYSLKKIEKLYMSAREGPVTHPGFALVSYDGARRSASRLDDAAAEMIRRLPFPSDIRLGPRLAERRVMFTVGVTFVPTHDRCKLIDGHGDDGSN